MRRGSRIATSAAAAGAIMAGAGAALAAIPHSGHAAKSPAKLVAATPSASATSNLDALQAQALANQSQVAALEKAIARAQASLDAGSRAQAEAAEAAERRAVAAAAAQAAQAAARPARPAAQTNVGHPAPPAVHTSTGASGSGGESEDHEDSHDHGDDD